jgi:DNA-binding IclR family transcriptional regulator
MTTKEATVSSPNKQASSSIIQSVQRALDILRCFTKEDAELGVTHISKQLDLHKSTVSRLLSTLEQEGFVEKNPETEKYRLGLELVTLAGIVLEQIDLREVAAPYLSQLAELTQETVNIVVLSGNECMNIDGAASPRPIRYVGRIGRRTPCYCTAAGKVLLAYLSPEVQQQILPDPLTRFTEKTIVEVGILAQNLTDIRQQGYAITHEEHQQDLSAVAAPIFDHTGQAIAAVTVSGPTYRIGPGEIEALVEPVLNIAREISTKLGSGIETTNL